MSNGAKIEHLIQSRGLTPRVTLARIDTLMERVEYVVDQRPGGTTCTFVHAFLDGKFPLATGVSACVDPNNFDPEIGETLARSKARQLAKDKLWEFEGYALYQRMVTLPV